MVLERDRLSEVIEKEAPEAGRYAAYFRKSVEYRDYDDIKEVICSLRQNPDKLLELHIFNNVCEVRAIYSERKKGYIYHKEKGNENDINDKINYMCETVLDIKDRELMIVNKISYDENGMILIKNYRMAIPMKGGNK